MLVVGSCRVTFAGTGGHVWTFLHSRCDSLLDDHYEIKMRRMTMMMMMMMMVITYIIRVAMDMEAKKKTEQYLRFESKQERM